MGKCLVKSEAAVLQNIFRFYDIKRDLLFYDKVGVFNLDIILKKLHHLKTRYHSEQELFQNAINEIQFLVDKGYFIDHDEIVDRSISRIVLTEDDIKLRNFIKDLKEELDATDTNKIELWNRLYIAWDELNTRLWCGIANRVNDKHYFVAGLFGFSSFDLPSEIKSKAYTVIQRMLPLPADNVPWEKIFDFKNDVESRLNLYKLRTWLDDLPPNLKQNEMEDKLNYLHTKYELSLKRHKIETRLKSIKTIIKTIPIMASELVRLRLDKAIDPIFDIAELAINFQRSEERSNLPGNEIAYISIANDNFSSQ